MLVKLALCLYAMPLHVGQAQRYPGGCASVIDKLVTHTILDPIGFVNAET